jgi:voltage-gated potassium channel
MPILFVRLFSLRPRVHALTLVAAAAFCVLAGGAVFAATQHLPVTKGWYWAIETATTVGYGDVTPANASGRIVAVVVMLTTIPLLAAAFAVVTGSAVANGVRRLLEMGARFPDGSYVLVLGMHPAVSVVLQELANAGDSTVLIADVDPSAVPGHVHFIRGDPTAQEVLARGRPESPDCQPGRR